MEFASSSSSSSSSFLKSEPHFIYDVFINFGGEDIGRRFLSHLHYALLQAQVKIFISEENGQEGTKMEEHLRAIAASKIAIIVFSKTYAESTCCLLELEEIIECLKTFGQIVLPVFYEIDPLDVRDQTNDFGKALGQTANKSYSGEELEHALSRWSRALAIASGITGWDLRNFRHDAEFVEVIVNRVQTLLDYKDLVITQFPVGLEFHVEKVIECIENHSTKVCMIGIWEMVGSGKTTIAKAIYNRIYHLFIGKSFVENLRKVWEPVDRWHLRLQEEFLYDVLKSKFRLQTTWMGRIMIEKELSRKKLLIVLDWFGKGTAIIITTRDVHLLNRLKLNYVYRMSDMKENESLGCHGFSEAKPRKDLNKLVRNIVVYCGGLPLAL